MDYAKALQALAHDGVEFILVGGAAALFGIRCRCLDLDTLIKTKRAAGRPKDFDAIAELEAIARIRPRPS